LYFEYKSLNKSDLFQEKKLLPFNKDIVLKNITYQYPNTSKPVLKNVNLTILNKSTIGLIGSTGGGKTTTVDIILGLLETQEGTLEIDGEVITKKNLRAWQNVIGYVPQQIYLTDSTIATNIAFGQNSEKIDQKALERASKIANLHDFVINELPKKYQTTVGERGVRLSGGQIQRIAIARALYNNPRLLILDEATNALDNQTEKAVIDAIDNIKKEVTIIMIAHRLNTLKRCDKIYKIEKNSLVSCGAYEQLIQPK
jgi:ABC-type multidrug transport system fused ATPase/permease subunit